MTRLDELIAAREDVIKAYDALCSLDKHELYSVRVNSPFEFLKESNLVEVTQNMRNSNSEIWQKLDTAIDDELGEFDG